MGDSFLVCACGFCKANSSSNMQKKNWKLSVVAGVFILLLLLGSCEPNHFTRETEGKGTERGSQEQKNNSQKDTASQKLSKPDEDHSCRALGRCRPCSWLDMNRKVPECLEFGFKQRSYCTSVKKEKFTSCRYVPNSNDARTFWLFEGSMWSVGILAYAIATLRNRKIELRTARRIQQQINA